MHATELDLFVTAMPLEDTPAVLSLGKLCEDHGYSYEWTSGQLIKEGRRINCSTENYVPIVVPGPSTGSSSSATPTSPTSLPQEAVIPTQHPASTRRESTSSTVWGSLSPKPAEAEKQIKMTTKSTEKLVARSARMVRRVHGESCGKSSSSTGTHPRVLLVSHLQSREQKWYRASTVLKLTTERPKLQTCQRTKITRAPCRRRIGGVVPRAENVGDLKTADHKVLSESCESRNNHRYAIVVQDLAAQWIQSYPCKNKTSQETQRSLQKFLEPNGRPGVVCTCNSLDFGESCEELSWNHCTPTPHRSETNGIA